MIFFRDYYYYNSIINWPDNSVYFWGPYDAQIQAIGVAAENNVQHQMPIDLTVVGVEIRNSVGGTKATSETSSFDLYINSGATIEALGTLDMTASYNSYSDHTLGISLLSTDTFSIRCTNPAWATNPTAMFGMTVRLYFDTRADDNLYLKVFRTGAALTPANGVTYYFNGSGHTTYQTSEKFYWQSPYDGLIKHASLCCKSTTGTSPQTISTGIYINGSPAVIDNTMTWAAGSNRVMVNDIGLAFSAGDTITIGQTTDTFTGTPPSQICIVNDLLIEKTS